VEHCGAKFQGGETDGRHSALGRSGERHAARRVRWLQTVPITAVCQRVECEQFDECQPVSLVRRQTTSSDRADHPEVIDIASMSDSLAVAGPGPSRNFAQRVKLVLGLRMGVLHRDL
jgi:hypothetical protein